MRVLDDVACLLCKRKMKAFALPRHLVREHNIRPFNDSNRPLPRLFQVNAEPRHATLESRRQQNDVESLENDDREMDATRGWGGSFREEGRFGSHPSHDDFGDESEP